MNQIPKCHICGCVKTDLGGSEYVCEYAPEHDSRPEFVAWHLPERVMIIEGLRHKFYNYRKEAEPLE